MLICVINIILYSSSVYSCHLFLISSASIRSIPILSFIMPIFAWNIPLVSLIFLRSLVSSILLFFSFISLHWSVRKSFLSLLDILWNSTFIWVYLSFYPLSFTSFLYSAIYKASWDSHFAFFHFFFLGTILMTTFWTIIQTYIHNSFYMTVYTCQKNNMKNKLQIGRKYIQSSYVTRIWQSRKYIFFKFISISWRQITLQYCSGFCHTLTWFSLGFTCVPHPDPPSRLPPPPIPLGLPSPPIWALVSCIQPGLVICFNLDSILVSMLFPQTFHPHLLPQSPKVYSVYLCPFFCFAYRVIITIFLNSIYMCQYTVLVFVFLAYFTLYNGLQFHPSH